MLELRGVSKAFAGAIETVRAVRDVSMTVDPGEIVALYGPSGSGKTTLLLMAAAALAPDAGSVVFGGRDVAALSGDALSAYRREHVGIASQDPHLHPGLTVLQNAAVKLLSGPASVAEAQRQALPWLGRFGLSGRLEHLPEQLSGGEQRRVALARALAGDPSFLLLDEPTSNLDSERGGEILDIIAEVASDGTGVLLVTHDEAATRIATRAHELRDGLLAVSRRVRVA